MTEDIRWRQRFDNYRRALTRLVKAAEIVASRIEYGEDVDDLLLPYNFDLSLFSSLSNPSLREHIDRVGIVIYDKNDNQ